ncbi:MAG: hypothetical protein BWY59_00446 [Verrucomicrobia bacterium ADurb.Bin345]|nr:MAG: hypothetical protein BWY59_00446 [Verrucomicrobia bacterium ADurb.Bin345]
MNPENDKAAAPWMHESEGSVVLSVRVVPRAAKDAVQGIMGEALKIRLCAPPVEGKANEALVRFLAKALDIPPSRVELVAGATGRNKRVRVRGLPAKAVQGRLLP